MSLETIVKRLATAFDTLNRRQAGWKRSTRVGPVRPRARAAPRPLDDAPDIGNADFVEQALPWMNAIHRFALGLTRGNEDAAHDLVQDTFLRAYRSWHSFEPGTNCRAWLFRICRNRFLHDRERASTRREVVESDLGDTEAAEATVAGFRRAAGAGAGDPEDLFSDRILDERVVEAIDALPDDYRDTLVLSDLGDLSYAEVAQVLGVPIGTVKSRLFRARQQLQLALVDYAMETGFLARGGE